MGALLSNPQILVQLRQSSRGKQPLTKILIFVMVILTTAFLLLRHFPAFAQHPQGVLYLCMGYTGLLYLVVLMVLGKSSTTLVAEMENKSLDILLTTPQTPWELALGKVAVAFVTGFELLIVLLPFYAVLALIGGLPLGTVLKMTAALTSHLWFCAALGTRISLPPREPGVLDLNIWGSMNRYQQAQQKMAALTTGLFFGAGAAYGLAQVLQWIVLMLGNYDLMSRAMFFLSFTPIAVIYGTLESGLKAHFLGYALPPWIVCVFWNLILSLYGLIPLEARLRHLKDDTTRHERLFGFTGYLLIAAVPLCVFWPESKEEVWGLLHAFPYFALFFPLIQIAGQTKNIVNFPPKTLSLPAMLTTQWRQLLQRRYETTYPYLLVLVVIAVGLLALIDGQTDVNLMKTFLLPLLAVSLPLCFTFLNGYLAAALFESRAWIRLGLFFATIWIVLAPAGPYALSHLEGLAEFRGNSGVQRVLKTNAMVISPIPSLVMLVDETMGLESRLGKYFKEELRADPVLQWMNCAWFWAMLWVVTAGFMELAWWWRRETVRIQGNIITATDSI